MTAKMTATGLIFSAMAILPIQALAQLHSGATVPGKTCTAHWQECVNFNKKAGAPTDRCDGYRATCMKEGRWR